MPRPTLSTARLELRPLGDEHLEFEVELDSDPEVMRYLLGRAATRTQVEFQHRRRLARGWEVDGLGYWVGFAGAAFVGWWILAPGVADDGGGPATGVAELGYRLQRRWWRRGLATEGARELLRYGFDECGLDRVVAETMAVNTGSRAVLTGLGLTHVRSFHEHFDEPVAGSEHGEVGYAMTRSQWQAARGADVRLNGVSDAPTAASATFTADVTLADLRGSIDNLDAALIHLLAERFKLTRTVGEFKAEHGLPAADPAREARQISRLRDLAAAASLDPVIAEKYLTFIVSEVVRHHEAIARDRA